MCNNNQKRLYAVGSYLRGVQDEITLSLTQGQLIGDIAFKHAYTVFKCQHIYEGIYKAGDINPKYKRTEEPAAKKEDNLLGDLVGGLIGGIAALAVSVPGMAVDAYRDADLEAESVRVDSELEFIKSSAALAQAKSVSESILKNISDVDFTYEDKRRINELLVEIIRAKQTDKI